MKIAIVHNWPGQKNSELELIKRIVRIAKDLGHQSTLISPLGHILTTEGKHLETIEFIESREYDFCLNLHYVNPNFFDTFSYAVNWNPLDYILRHPMNGTDLPADHIAYRTSCLASHDALLSAGSKEMDDFAVTLNLASKQQIFNNNLFLHTTSETTANLQVPDLSNFRIFYIGANWERQKAISRHGSLIERLDATNKVDFYGVRQQHGILLWEGVKNYQGELPFDGGISILEQSNRCGVSLVLHSKPHRNSALVSTRIFQACAAKTLTICDDNPFILKHFGDSVLTFPYSDDPAKNFAHIMEKVEWVNKNPAHAMEMAHKANLIFEEKFSLQKEVANLFASHPQNVAQYYEEFGRIKTSTLVDVLYIYKEGNQFKLALFFDDIAAQEGIEPKIIIFAPFGLAKEIKECASKYNNIQYKLIELARNDGAPLFEGHVLAHYLKTHADHWFALYSSNCRWKKRHLTQLLRASENVPDVAVATSATYVKNKQFTKQTDEYYTISMHSINTHPRAIAEHDIGNFAAKNYPSSAFIFNSSLFQDKNMLRALQFFDKGWAFFLVTWQYLQTHKLPVFVPQLTCIFLRNDDSWEIDNFITANQMENFERSMTNSIFLNDPHYLSIKASTRFLDDEGISTSIDFFNQFSLNAYINHILRFKPLLLKTYRLFFKAACVLLRIPYKEVLVLKRTEKG